MHNLTNIPTVELFGNLNFTFLGQLKERSTHGDGKSVCLLAGSLEISLPLVEPQKKKKDTMDC